MWPPQALLKYRLKKRLQYLELDDALFQRDGGVKLLKGDEEIRLAAEDRGIDIAIVSTNRLACHRMLGCFCILIWRFLTFRPSSQFQKTRRCLV